MSPLYKKDDPSLVSNYTPISLLNTIGKVMEKIIHKHISNFFNEDNVISCLLFGFATPPTVLGQSFSNFTGAFRMV